MGAAPVDTPDPMLELPPLDESDLVEKAAGDAPEDDAERLAAEAEFDAVVVAAFAAQLSRLRKAIERTESITTDLGGFWASENTALARDLLPLYDDVLAKAAQAGAGQLAIGVDWELVNTAVLKAARFEAEALSAALNNTSRANVARLIEDWIATGGNMQDLIKRVAVVYPEERAATIATTEVTRLYAVGNKMAWDGIEVVTGYRWNTANDEQVCPICGPLHKEEFPKSDDEHLPPAHPRCRCWITPVVMTPEEFAAR